MTEDDMLTLVPFDPDADTRRLAAWLARPHVAPWWPDAEHQLEQALHRPPGSGHALIHRGGIAVGYMRWQRVDREVADELSVPHGSIDMDILIGEPDFVGCGLGPRAVRMLCDRLLQDESVPLIGMVTSTVNLRAIRAFMRAGMSRLVEYEDPRYGRCVVLVRRASVSRSRK